MCTYLVIFKIVLVREEYETELSIVITYNYCADYLMRTPLYLLINQ